MMMAAEQVALEVEDAGRMMAHVARPAGAAQGGILLLQEAFGVNDHMRDLARRFATLGYTVIVPELYHRSAPGFSAAYDDFESTRPQRAQLTDVGLAQDLAAAWRWLVTAAGCAERRVASVGFCLGGYVSFLANLSLPLAASVSFYGAGIPRLLDRLADLAAPVVLFWGARDAAIDASQRQQVLQALDRADKPYTHVLFSMAGHGFFCDRRASYSRLAAIQAWALTEAFLAERIGA